MTKKKPLTHRLIGTALAALLVCMAIPASYAWGGNQETVENGSSDVEINEAIDNSQEGDVNAGTVLDEDIQPQLAEEITVEENHALYGGEGDGTLPTVHMGFRHSAAIDVNGSLWMWGENEYGQLGDGSSVDSSTPKKIMDDVVNVSLGNEHSAVIKTDGSLWMWGCNDSGQLGNGTTSNYFTPIKIMDDVQCVSLGNSCSAAVKTDGTLWTWGSNEYGRLGDSTTASSFTPKQIMDNVKYVSLGSNYSAAITTDGSLWMWGANGYGQLGDGTTTDKYDPIKVMDDIKYVSVSYHSAAIKTDGTLWMWGQNTNGQLGDETLTNSSSPIKVMENVKSVSVGTSHTAALKNDSTLWTWGNNDFGKLGNGTTTAHYIPVQILNDVSKVNLGHHNCAVIKTNGSLWTWGWGQYYQLGNGSAGYKSSPVNIMDLGTAGESSGSSPTPTAAVTPSLTPTPTAAVTPSPTPTAVATPSPTPTPTKQTPNLQVASSFTKTYGDAAFSLGASLAAGNGALSYASSDNSVVVVASDGTATITGAGTAVVTVSVAETDDYTAVSKDVAITVNKAPAGLSYNQDEVTAAYVKDGPVVNDLKADTDAGISYSSSNESVARVLANGEVAIAGIGTATITASAEENANFLAGTASFKLTVTGEEPVFEFDEEEITVPYGEEPFTNELIKKPSGTLSYSSSNVNVAKVDSTGKVTIVSAGAAVITVSIKAGGQYAAGSASYNLTVEKADAEISFADSRHAMAYGGSAYLNKLDVPSGVDGKVMYSTSKKSVATVNATTGKVIAKSVGKTTITAAIAEGKNYNACQASYQLTVNPPATKISKLTGQSKAIKAVWQKKGQQVGGYEIQCAANKKFTSGKKSLKVSSASKSNCTIKNLKKKKTYYVRIRTYKKVSGTAYYSAWSAVKSVRTK